ncbi:hypothetical protein ACOMHN_046274 [Nucella lapillus]
MGDVEKATGPQSWKDLHDVSSKLLVPGVTDEVVTDLYNQWANNGYDKALHEMTTEYGALKVLQQAVQDLFPSGRDTAVLLDVGAGTGLSGQMLHEIGFKIVDGLDPAADMLRVAEGKRVYRHIYNCYLTGQPGDIPADSYDCLVMAGVVGPGSLPCAAFEEMTRIVKPGGYIVNCMRGAWLKKVPDYSQNWEPLKKRLETEGKWKVLKMDPYPNHFMGNEGLCMVFQVQ